MNPDLIPTVALVGNPNVGKSTLFNALTGGIAKVGNVAGVTVDVQAGDFFNHHGNRMRVFDLPGCMSLDGDSPDQRITSRMLCGELPGIPGRPDLVVCVVDASHLERHLAFAMEVIETGLPVVLALNMIDMAEAAGIRLDPPLLARELGVPVIPIQADRRIGLPALKLALNRVSVPQRDHAWLEAGGGIGVRQNEALRLCALAARRPGLHQAHLSDRLDAWLLHPFWGWVAMLAAMFLVFWSIFSFAEVPMGWVEAGQGWLETRLQGVLPPGDLRDLLVDGVIGGVGSVVIFLPQIVMLFFFIGLLESSGYMARAAFLMDGLMGKAGLSGKAFLPLLSSYACAIPGILATRSMSSPKERLVTIFVAPWMSCTARLPVYFLLIPMLLGGAEGGLVQALVLMCVYLAGTLSAFAVARFLRGRLGPDAHPRHFTLELPPYRMPQWRFIFLHLADRARSFLAKAGTVILGISIVLWALATYPKSDSGDPAEQLANSAIGRISAVIEPVVRPLGFDGRTGTAILTSFAAREVFNATMFQVFRVDAEDDLAGRQRLRKRLTSETWDDGKPMFRPLSVVSLLVFYMFALQCLPTSAVSARESGSWKWAAAQFFFMSGIAFTASLVIYQTGSLLGF